MKSDKGVTLISVTIYVIAMVLLVAVISVITSYFYKNIKLNVTKEDLNKQYTKFISYFSEEANLDNNRLLEVSTDDSVPENKVSYVIFSSENQYTFMQKNKSIYVGKVKIATYVKDCNFIKLNDNSVKVNIVFEADGHTITRTNTFNLKK